MWLKKNSLLETNSHVTQKMNKNFHAFVILNLDD